MSGVVKSWNEEIDLTIGLTLNEGLKIVIKVGADSVLSFFYLRILTS